MGGYTLQQLSISSMFILAFYLMLFVPNPI